jgi:hypothetical protein
MEKSVIKKKGYVGSMKSCKRTVSIFQIFIYLIIKQAVLGQEQEKLQIESYQQNYAAEDLRLQLDQASNKIEEKNIQLESKTIISPSISIPAMQGNELRIKVVVSQLFKEILQLKGSKMIYANIIIDRTQNKYIRLEPV